MNHVQTYWCVLAAARFAQPALTDGQDGDIFAYDSILDETPCQEPLGGRVELVLGKGEHRRARPLGIVAANWSSSLLLSHMFREIASAALGIEVRVSAVVLDSKADWVPRCDAGDYFTESARDCKPCLPGAFCPPRTTERRMNETFGCPMGYKCPEGSVVPRRCPRGTYGNTTRAAECTKCPGGTTTEEDTCTSPSACRICNQGSFAASGQERCTSCPSGSVSKSGGTVCIDCVKHMGSKGWSPNDDASECVLSTYYVTSWSVSGVLLTSLFLVAYFASVERQAPIREVRYEGDEIILATCGPHRFFTGIDSIFRSKVPRTWKRVHLTGTGHPLLDDPTTHVKARYARPELMWLKIISKDDIEFAGDVDTAMGDVRLHSVNPHHLVLLIWILICLVASLVIEDSYRNFVAMCLVSGLSVWMAAFAILFWKFVRAPRPPLERELQLCKKTLLKEAKPKHCACGPMHTVTAGNLVEFHDFFLSLSGNAPSVSSHRISSFRSQWTTAPRLLRLLVGWTTLTTYPQLGSSAMAAMHPLGRWFLLWWRMPRS